MALKQEHALLVGAATVGVVIGVFQLNMPTVAGSRASKPDNQHLDAARRSATITCVSLVALFALLASDPTVFITGGIATVLLDGSHRVANATDNASGKVPLPSASGAVSASGASVSVGT